MLRKIHVWWMKLDPSEQYMYWIITFAGMLFTGVLLFVVGMHFNLVTFKLFPFIFGGISLFLTLFVAVVIYLNLIWPNIYEKEQLKYKDE